MKKKLVIVMVMITISLVVFSTVQYRENQRYTEYLSDNLTNIVVPLSSSIVENQQILDKVVDSNSITFEQLSILSGNYQKIMEFSQDLNEMANYLKKKSLDDGTPAIANKIHFYLMTLEKRIKRDERIKLGQEELSNFELIKELNSLYFEVVKENIKGISANGVNSETSDFLSDINKKYWVNIAQQLSDISREYKHLFYDLT